MIIREWRGRASSSQAGAYPKHFREKVIPELRHVPGFAGAQLGRRQLGDKIEFLVLTRWRSMDAIRAFAGMDVEATDRARGYFKGYGPSSPSIALFKDGRLVHMMERRDIEGREADQIAALLRAAFEQHCARAA